MRVPALPFIALAVATMAGCATRTGSDKTADIPPPVETLLAQPCDAAGPNGDCRIDLEVKDVDSTKCEITLVNKDSDLILMQPGGGPFTVLWRIMPVTGHADYSFTEDDGITFINNFRPRGFRNGRRDSSDPKKFRWKNLNQDRKVYAYIINVVDSTGIRECSLDPWIRNK